MNPIQLFAFELRLHEFFENPSNRKWFLSTLENKDTPLYYAFRDSVGFMDSDGYIIVDTTGYKHYIPSLVNYTELHKKLVFNRGPSKYKMFFVLQKAFDRHRCNKLVNFKNILGSEIYDVLIGHTDFEDNHPDAVKKISDFAHVYSKYCNTLRTEL